MRKFIATSLVVLMILSMIPMTVFASDFDTTVSNDYFSVISSNVYQLCDGATETELILNNSEGSDRKVVHYFEVDPKNENIEVLPGYYGIDKLDPDNLALDGILDKNSVWSAKELTKTVAYYESLGYNVVGGMNTALAYDSNAPYGYMVMDGVVLGTPQVHSGAQTYLAIDAEGNCELRSMSTPLNGTEVTAISANFGWLVKNGKLTSNTVERTSSDASRSMIGIKADGTLIFCQVDGRNAPVSTGLSNYEMGEMMLSLGCVNAVNCDGGGSSTFVSKREGETSNTMRSIPSDGSERATINSVILVSNAKPTGEFDHAVLSTDYDYYAPGTSAVMNIQGVDSAGSPAELPEDGITWSLSDNSYGTISDGVFTSNGTKGNVTIQMYYNEELVGEKLIKIVDPDVFALALDETVLPYGKDMNIEFACTYGADDWSVCVDGAYTLTLSDDNAATLEGNVLTASNDLSFSGVNVTATYNSDSSVSDVLKITYGKGSEVVFDFEDGNLSNFLGVDEMYDWAAENGAPAPIQSNGNYSSNADSTTFLSSDIVKNGEYSLGVTLDYTDAEFAGWSYNMFFYTGESVVLRDVANGNSATTLGAWVYIPEGAAGLAMQIQGCSKPDGTGGTGGHFYFTTASGAKKNLNSCTEADIPESRWVYATVDLTQFGDYFATYPPYGNTGREPSFIRYYIKPTTAANLTFYFDDFTLDYSSAVDDRVLPTITDVCYANADTAITLDNNATINSNSMTFSAVVADNVKLDNSSAKILVDGNALNNVSVSGKYLASEQVTLLPGIHTVTFEISDTLGNLARVTRTFTVAGDSFITLTGHNDSDTLAEVDSVYYVDINTADISAINKLTTELKLQSANTWEPQGMTVANGFDVTYELDEVENILTLTIERNGNAVNSTDTNLVSVPVRLWSWNGINHVTDTPIKPEVHYATGYCPVINIECKVLTGTVELSKDYSNYTSAFGGKFSEATKINDTVYAWHVHDSELTVLNTEATCTTDGYSDRTYCKSCKSVIDWGTITKASGHSYEVVDGKLACSCGDTLTTSGIVTINGDIYYSINGKLSSGWIVDNNVYYYFDNSTFKGYKDGRYKINNFWYTFDENGVHTEGQWVNVITNGEYNTRYYFAGKYIAAHFQEIDGKTYWFDKNGNLAKGIQLLRPFEGAGISNLFIYDIDENGVVNGPLDYTGVYNLNGTLYYVVDGKVNGGGVIDIDGDLYYVEWNGVVDTGKVYVVAERTNGLVNVGWNYFGEDGKLINNDLCTVDGTTYYIVNGQPAKGYGVIQVDGNLYYINSTGAVGTGKLYVTAAETNSLVNAGYIYTDETGRIYDNEFAEIDGKILYVVKGQPVKSSASAVKEIDGELYFVEWNGNIPTGKIYISAAECNGLTTAGWHYTDETGKFYNNEVVEVEDTNYYMINGKPYATGESKVQELNGELYFVEWNGNVATGKQYIGAEYVNGLTTAGWHYTDETGRLYNNELATIDGKIYYMVHGQMDRTGVSKVREINGELYFVEWNGHVPTGKQYIGAEYVNGLTSAGWHYTDETGRLYDNEFTTIDGKIYYMVHGQMDRSGVSKVREINDELYFVEWNGHVPTGKQYIGAEYVNGLTTAGWHYTDETGRLYDNELATIDGSIYYMVHGQMDRTGTSEIREINDTLYYVEWNGHVATGKIYVSANETNDYVTAGWVYADETGALYNDEFVEISGTLYFMENGTPVKNGIFEFNGGLYYAMWNGTIARNGKFYITDKECNDLIIFGNHTFDANGKMIA